MGKIPKWALFASTYLDHEGVMTYDKIAGRFELYGCVHAWE